MKPSAAQRGIVVGEGLCENRSHAADAWEDERMRSWVTSGPLATDALTKKRRERSAHDQRETPVNE